MFNWFKRSSKSGTADRPARPNEQRPQVPARAGAAVQTPTRIEPAPVPASAHAPVPATPQAPVVRAPAASAERHRAGGPATPPEKAAAASAGQGGYRPPARPIAARDIRAAGVILEQPPVLANLPASLQQLSPHAQRILARLPPEARLDVTCARYPHAAESLLRHWTRPDAFRQALDALMIDTRGNRQGFPFEVMMEFTALRDYYEARVAPHEFLNWDLTDVR